MKKLLSMDDLVNFCENRQMYNFDSTETGYQICVQVPSMFEKDEEENSSMLYGKVKAFHTNRNRNGSNVTKEAAEKAMKTMAYKPLLANFCEIDGVKDFTSHDMGINDDGDLEYYEHQIGCFTADEPTMEYDEENDRYYVIGKVAIPREYTAAADIIERKGGTKVSAELAINKMSYNAKEKELMLEDIEMIGLTCLGKNPETGENVEEGMQGSRLDIEDFSRKNNSVKFDTNEKLIEALEKLNTTLSHFDIDNATRKEEVEEVGDLENMEVAEEVEATAEVIENEEVEEAEVTTDEVTETTEDEATEVEENTETEETPEDVATENESVENNVTYSVECGDKKYNFSTSLSEKMNAIYTLVNDTYAEQDNDYYDVDVFEEEGRVEMYGWFSGKSYRQQFKCKKDTYSLVGDRTETFKRFLTQDEINALDKMKADYAELETKFAETSDKLSKYEAEPDKMAVLESEDYSQIANTDEFIALKERDAHFDMSVDEVRAKADEMLLSFAKNNKLEFSAENKIEVGKKMMPIDKKNTERRGRYGGMFHKKED